jgi:hypothetical protein
MGATRINADGRGTYTPNHKARGEDSFAYTVSDSKNMAPVTVAF